MDASGLIIKLHDVNKDVKIDIMLNKEVEIENSLLIGLYTRYDQRLHKLITVLKHLNSRKESSS